MMKRCVLCVACLALVPGCGEETDPAESQTICSFYIPDEMDLEGWITAEGPDEYLPESLYEYLDGAAPRYLTYGFRRLVHVRFQLGDDLLSSVTLDAYDMGDDLGAFGIYSSGRSPDSVPRDWCVESHRTGTVAAAWKGSVFVHAEADDDRPELIEMIERLVARACAEIPGDDSPPAILAVLPPEGLIPRTERYVADDLLGHAFLPGGVLAEYDIDGRGVTLFFSDLESDAAAKEAMGDLRAHYSQLGAIVGDAPSIGEEGFRFSDPGLGSGAVVGAGRYVAGVHGDLPQDAQSRLLARLVENLGER
jgi:hypothetical protein